MLQCRCRMRGVHAWPMPRSAGAAPSATDARPPPSAARCRSVEADDKIFVTPARRLTLEDAIGYVGPDELVEVTPSRVRLRKQVRSASQRRAKARRQE